MKRSRRVGFGSSARRNTPPQLEASGFKLEKPDKCKKCSPDKKSRLSLTAANLNMFSGTSSPVTDDTLSPSVSDVRPRTAENLSKRRMKGPFIENK